MSCVDDRQMSNSFITCFDSSKRFAMIFRTFVTGLSTNPSPRVPSVTAVFLLLAIKALSRSVDFIEPNKPEAWVIVYNLNTL